MSEEAASLIKYIVFELKNNESFIQDPSKFTKQQVYGKFGQELAKFRPCAETKEKVEVNMILFEYLF